MADQYSPIQADYFVNADARWNILAGAARSGKSWVSIDKIPKRIVQLPRGEMMLIGKTERTLQRNVIYPMQERFGTKHISHIRHDGTVSIFGRRFNVLGANDTTAVDKLRGAGLVYAYCDEAAVYPSDFTQMLKGRLSHPGAMCDMTMNPESPYHLIKTDFIDRAGDINCNVYSFTLDDNPFLDAETKANIKREYTGVWHKRMVEGIWCAAQGQVYNCFDEELHVVDEVPTKFDEYFVACDYGTGNPTVFLLAGVIGDEAWILDEYRHDPTKDGRYKTDGDYSLDMQQFIDGYAVERIFVDPSAASFKVQMFRDGLSSVMDANNAVLDGIRFTASVLQRGKIHIHRRCKALIQELYTYVWDDKAQKLGIDAPLKRNDHSVDAFRYLIYGIRASLGSN